MNSSKLIIAIIVIMVIGFSIIGYSMLSLYSEVQKEVINLNSTILHASNETQTGLSNKIANLANEIGFLESKVNNLNSSAYSSINSLQKQLNQLVYQLNFPVTIIDATNTSVTIPSYPERIISLDPASTEILLSIGAGNQLIGVDNDSFYYLPPNFEKQLITLYNEGKLVNIGSTYSGPNIETIIAERPDLVIGTYQWSFSSTAQVLKNYGIPVVLLPSYNSLSDLYTAIIMVGKATGHVNQAVNLVENISKEISYIRQLTQNVTPQNVSYLLWINPTYVAAGGTFQNDMITLSGNNNAFSNMSGWPVISPEELLKANPSIIIIDSNYGLINESDLIFWLNQTIGNAYENISAIKYGKVYAISGYYEDYLNEPGPMVVQGIELFVSITHPSILNITSVPELITPNDFNLTSIS